MNTRDKRASVLGLGLAALLVLPEPGSLDQGDRQQVSFSYRGILATELVVVDAEASVIITMRADVASIRMAPDVTAITMRPDASTIKEQAP